jgi:hypothetical protein
MKEDKQKLDEEEEKRRRGSRRRIKEICPAIWRRDSNICLVFCVFASRPTSRLASVEVSLFVSNEMGRIRRAMHSVPRGKVHLEKLNVARLFSNSSSFMEPDVSLLSSQAPVTESSQHLILVRPILILYPSHA